AQPRRDERAVEHLAPGLCLVCERLALGAAQKRLGARQESARGDVVDRMAELLLERLAEVALGDVQAGAERACGPLDGEGRGGPHPAPRGLQWKPACNPRGTRAPHTDLRPGTP